MSDQREIQAAERPEVDEQAYWKTVKAAQVLAQSRGWLVRYGIERGKVTNPDYTYTIDPKQALALYKQFLHQEDKVRQCFAEYLDPEGLDILDSATLLEAYAEAAPVTHEYSAHLQALKRQLTHLDAELRSSLPGHRVNWQRAERLCALLHSLVDHVQRSVVLDGELHVMSAAQTAGPIPCVFGAKDESEEEDDTRSEKPIFIEVASDVIVHGLTVYVHTDDPGPRSSPGEAVAAVFLEHYQHRAQLQLFDAENGPGGDMHWIAPGEDGTGKVSECQEREQESSLVLIPDTRVKNNGEDSR